MAQTVDEIMNRELLLARPSEPAVDVLERLLSFRVSGAPVIDQDGAAVGVASWKDLIGRQGTVGEAMTSPASTVPLGTSIEHVAHLLAELGHHRLVVVNSAGAPIGVVTTLDVVRALVGAPVSHPDAFPHYDPESRLVWTDPVVLDLQVPSAVPMAPGLLVLLRGARGVSERVVWAEVASDLKARVADIVSNPAKHIPQLLHLHEQGELRFRVAPSADIGGQMAALRAVLYRARDQRRHAGRGESTV